MVATMSVPPTSTAEAITDHSACVGSGSAVRSAMVPCSTAQMRQSDLPAHARRVRGQCARSNAPQASKRDGAATTT